MNRKFAFRLRSTITSLYLVKKGSNEDCVAIVWKGDLQEKDLDDDVELIFSSLVR